MMMRSRLRLTPARIKNGVSRIAASPGPPAKKTIGSDLAGLEREGTIATKRRIVRLVRSERFSGTIKNPQRAVFSSAIGSGVVGHGAASKRGVGDATGPARATGGRAE